MELFYSKDVENVDCSTVEESDIENIMPEVEDMIKFCLEKGGAGISAPQVGIKKKVIVWYNRDVFHIGFNPKYYPDNVKVVNTVEQCLSYPDESYYIQRHKYIRAVYYSPDQNGKLKRISRTMNSEESIVFQHETDHINGITISMIGKKL